MTNEKSKKPSMAGNQYSVSVYMRPSELAEIDAVRGNKNRSNFIKDIVFEKIGKQEAEAN